MKLTENVSRSKGWLIVVIVLCWVFALLRSKALDIKLIDIGAEWKAIPLKRATADLEVILKLAATITRDLYLAIFSSPVFIKTEKNY